MRARCCSNPITQLIKINGIETDIIGLKGFPEEIYALNVEKIDITANASLVAFEKTIEGKVLATAKITGTYEI